MTGGNPEKIIAPSILSADFSRLGDEVRDVTKAGADWIHVDVMDGHFVPNITAGPVLVQAVRRSTRLFCDVHLMIENPANYLKAFAEAGADSITVHQEVCGKNLPEVIAAIRKLGIKPGVSISPETPPDAIFEVLPLIDLALVMTVNPGFGGQALIEPCIGKIRALDRWRREQNLKFLIEADGGIAENTAANVSAAGCNVFVAGSAIFKTRNYKSAINKIRAKL